ncbi:MAG: 3-keto-disaccharide hydrolase [Thermoguttaceae bacterium]
MRTILLFSLITLPFLCSGCEKPRSADAEPAKSDTVKSDEILLKIEPLKIDEAAAYPKQELGTRPPVLTGYNPLTKEQINEGWIALFDGVSTYGWKIAEGSGTLNVGNTQGNPIVLYIEEKPDQECFVDNFIEDVQVIFPVENKIPKFKISGINVSASGSSATVDGLSSANLRFGGKPLTESDWKPASGDAKSEWKDGVLEIIGGSGSVESVNEYGNFVLQLEYKTDPKVNSGVFFRCVPGSKMDGYECQIFNDPPADDFKKFLGTETGGIFRRAVGRNIDPKDGEWNKLLIYANGNKIATWVNGIQAVQWTDERAEHENPRNGSRTKPGTIQLQGHDPSTKIWFRNFKMCEL